jgi:hypothetical protein
LEDFPCVAVDSITKTPGKSAKYEGRLIPRLKGMTGAVLFDRRGKPKQRLRVLDLRPHDQRGALARVRFCSAQPHSLSSGIFAQYDLPFESDEERVYLLLSEPDVGSPHFILNLLEMRYIPEAPFATEIYKEPRCWRFELRSTAGAFRFRTLLSLLPGNHSMVIREGHLTYRVGANPGLERLQVPSGWVEPVIVLGRVPEGVIERYLSQGFLAYMSGQIGLVIPKQVDPQSLAVWQPPPDIDSSATIRLQACEAGGAIKDEATSALKKGAACVVSDTHGAHLSEATPFCTMEQLPNGVQGIFRSTEPRICVVTFEWNQEKPNGVFHVWEYTANWEAGRIVVSRNSVIEGQTNAVSGQLSRTRDFSPSILAAKRKSFEPGCLRACKRGWT